MLEVVIPEMEFFDEKTNRFINIKEQKIAFEHSLISISKWESMFKKPFLTKESKTDEEIMAYVECMTITKNVDPLIYKAIPDETISKISNYISDSMTATTFSKDGGRSSKEIITSELIYYWMIAYNIPVEFEKWHLNRLLTLIQICNIKNSPGKKMSQKSIMSQNAKLNAMRRKAMNSKG